jgi:hypothetical protein
VVLRHCRHPDPSAAATLSSNTDETRGCKGKKRYWFYRRAVRAARAIAELEGEPFHAYHCRHCHRFHVGSHIRAAKVMK